MKKLVKRPEDVLQDNLVEALCGEFEATTCVPIMCSPFLSDKETDDILF